MSKPDEIKETPIDPPKLYALRHVRLFHSGRWEGVDYTDDDILSMASNGRKFANTIRPMISIGHEEVQPLTSGMPSTTTQNSGEPAYGRGENFTAVREVVDGKRVMSLYGDLVEMPPWLAADLLSKAYRGLSVEIYTKPPEGVEFSGMAIRRISLLGAEPPKVKTLGDLPRPVLQRYSETRSIECHRRHTVKTVTTDGGIITAFSEVNPMAQKTKHRRVDVTKFSERERAAWKRFDELPAQDQPVPAGVSREDMISLLSQSGYDVSLLDGVSDAAIAEMVRVLKTSQEGEASANAARQAEEEPPPPPDDANKDGDQPTDQEKQAMAECTPKKMSEMLADLKAARVTLDQIKAESARALAEAKTAKITKFCEEMLDAGKLLPVEIEKGFKTHLLSLDGSIRKFGENSSQTQLDAAMEMVRSRPALVKMSEQISEKNRTVDADAEDRKVRRFAERNADQFAKTGKTVQTIVSAFQTARAKNPQLTAEKMYGPSVNAS